MKADYHIQVYLPTDRRLPGFMRIATLSGFRPVYDLPCRGKADSANANKHRNRSRDPRHPWGDTPAGRYRPTRVIRYDPRHRSFGFSAILLEGRDGDALTAAQNGRTGLAIHGGRGNDKLTATYGCIRLFDRDMDTLIRIIGDRIVHVEVIDCPTWPPATQPINTGDLR